MHDHSPSTTGDPSTAGDPSLPLTFRPPTQSDAARIWRLVSECEVLQANSCYAYLLLCRDFAETCLVAVADDDQVRGQLRGQLRGFVLGYRLPAQPEVLFVWQVGVAPEARRSGLGRRLLHRLVESRLHDDVRYLEATVAPSNTASRRLFQRLADDLAAALKVLPGFVPEDFGGPDHEPEDRLRIGPFSAPVPVD